MHGQVFLPCPIQVTYLSHATLIGKVHKDNGLMSSCQSDVVEDVTLT